MIRVKIEVEHYDGSFEVVRDDSVSSGHTPASETLKALVAAAEASALAAMTAKSEQR